MRIGNRVRQGFARTADYYPRLDALGDFMQLQGAPLANKYNDVSSVKLVYEYATKRLYFVNSQKYRFHREFCRRVLGDNTPLLLYNATNYGSSARDYLLANLNRYGQSRQYTLEFASEDEVSAKQADLLYRLICDNSYLEDSLRVLLSSDRLHTLHAKGDLKSPVSTVDDIYAAQRFQALNTGTSYGILRVEPEIAKTLASVRPTDIIVVKGTPVAVPVCAGILSDMFQTPLSHISVLCHGRNIPAAAQRDIFKAVPAALIGKPVALQITEEGLRIEPATQAQVDSYDAQRQRSQRAAVLGGNRNYRDLQRLDRGSPPDEAAIGSKAAGLARLRLIAEDSDAFSVPEGAFAIPYYWYAEHMKDAGVQLALNALLQASGGNASDRSPALKNLRDAIRSAPLNPELHNAVVAMMTSMNAGPDYRFRSSSNAEDLAGFSGAGLYESKTGSIRNPEKPVDDAIRKVWASTWNDAAFFEREASGIDQRSVLMAVLCHRNFPDEAINGVAITRHLYRNNFPGFTINAQTGETSVVSPPPGISCEQLVLIPGERFNPLSSRLSIEYIGSSSLTNGRPVLSAKQAERLLQALSNVKRHYFFEPKQVAPESQYEAFALDLEFKFERNGKLYLKQVRPYR